MKVLHAADLHLDSPLRGLVEYEGAPVNEVRRATRRAFVQLMDVALAERVDLVLLAGDLYDGDFRDFSTALFLVEQLSRLREIGAEVVWIRGNHDAESRITKHLRLPSFTHELPSEEPGTICLERLGIAIHGQSYRTRDIDQNLALSYPKAHSGLLNVGLLHTALEGREGHQLYAPCTVGQLTALGYDYFALGHVHQREIVSSDPYIVFPGNLQGRSIRETGPKGAILVEFSGSGVEQIRPVIVDTVRWALLEVGLDGVEHWHDALDIASQGLDAALLEAEGRTLACRFRLVGQTRAHRELVNSERLLNELRGIALERGSVYVESVDVRTHGELSLRSLAWRGDAFAETISASVSGPGSLKRKEELAALFVRELGSLPQELVRAELDDMDAIWAESGQLLEARLLEGGSGAEDKT